MDGKIRVCQVFNNNPHGSRLRGRPKTDGGNVYKQIIVNSKLQMAREAKRTELTGGSPLRRRRFALDCSVI
jgi:hypothetical protein